MIFVQKMKFHCATKIETTSFSKFNFLKLDNRETKLYVSNNP